jgi:type II secretory pathway pseudopilin PulG
MAFLPAQKGSWVFDRRNLMRSREEVHWSGEPGFSLTEILVAILITMIVMAAVFGLLQRGQDSFRREPEVADLNMNARVGLDRISRDLLLAGLKTPPGLAVIWTDGGGINPDEITIMYADPNFPTCLPVVEPPSSTINTSSTLVIDTPTMEPSFSDPMQAYSKGQVLFAFELSDCNGDGLVGVHPFELTQDPRCTGAGCSRLNLNHNPAAVSGLNLPGGFNGEVKEDCTQIGYYHVIQYRINPLPPAPNPTLERRDLAIDDTWTPVATNIENLQFEYAPRGTGAFTATPTVPLPDDTTTWVTGVRVTVAGRTESKDLQGASEGVFDPDDTHLRKTFSTVVNLRNVVGEAEAKEFGALPPP